MNDFDILNEVEWHDGVFLGAQLNCRGGGVDMTISVSVYNDDKRNEFDVEFVGIESLNMSMDTMELIDNHNAGNISNGYVKKQAINQRVSSFYIFQMGI